VNTIVERVKSAPEGTSPRDALKTAIEEANARIWAMPTAEAGFRPGSTVVAALIHGGGVDLAHVGDSRIYLLHAGAVSQVTRDHSMVQELVDRNLIRAEDAAKHPDANKILPISSRLRTSSRSRARGRRHRPPVSSWISRTRAAVTTTSRRSCSASRRARSPAIPPRS
jgi:serine/threonine protein phosphatase PrpC